MTNTEFEKAYESITTDGWLTENEAKILWDTAQKTKGVIVEVGSYRGRSASLLGKLGRPIICIDPWDDRFHSELSGDEIFAHFKENTKGLDVTPMRMKVENWTPILAEFVYLDGDHTYEGTVAQIKKALECNPKYIAIHDVNDSGGGVEIKRAAIQLLGDYQLRSDRLAIWNVR